VELTPMPEPDALAAALLRLSEHADKLARLDQRQAADTAEITERIAALTKLANAMKQTLDDQAEILTGLRDLEDHIADFADRLEELAPDDPAAMPRYQPSPTPRFWKVDGQTRDEAIARQLAASLGSCWEQHPLCLYALDWLSELWSVLYLQPRRTAGTLASQAEWQTRLLTAAAEQMAAETAHCEHAVLRSGRPVRIGARP
jgi:hypothetical protein